MGFDGSQLVAERVCPAWAEADEIVVHRRRFPVEVVPQLGGGGVQLGLLGLRGGFGRRGWLCLAVAERHRRLEPAAGLDRRRLPGGGLAELDVVAGGLVGQQQHRHAEMLCEDLREQVRVAVGPSQVLA